MQEGDADFRTHNSAQEDEHVVQASPIIQSQRSLGQTQEKALGYVNDPYLKRSLILSEKLKIAGAHGGIQKSVEASSSHLPCINLLVDLNDAACRKRRRRQLSNLFLIQKEVAREASSGSESFSSSGETLQSNSPIEREVRATMAVGAELGVCYTPADEQCLRRMIQMETEECLQSSSWRKCLTANFRLRPTARARRRCCSRPSSSRTAAGGGRRIRTSGGSVLVPHHERHQRHPHGTSDDSSVSDSMGNQPTVALTAIGKGFSVAEEGRGA
ncbi:hypothetical protein RHGRI_038060 [Rhododendron griersonianum]|uniref:Uncharacterized protein n=1 Tax=Rhododendron griersonianum TaxID=479676 RepID=A0AAV6HUR5_9ERIC|nr:hypothetical protein RHGRI_038060 [Rhododendron griersonianum]